MGSRTKSATLGRKKGAPALTPISEVPTSPVAKKFSSLGIEEKPQQSGVAEWEVRPGGMLVQKRDPDADATARPLPPPIRVRVKYGSVSHEIYISPQASFGELKKLLSAQVSLHPRDQKILFKDKERSSNAFLDMSGVKDRSKLVLVEDPASQAKRFLEMRKNAKMEKAAKSISQTSLEVDRLASQVSLLEAIISKGKKVAEKDVLRLIEQLMDILIKLDGIVADGDVMLQRGMQVRRVQKYIETLDMLKMKNAMPKDNDAQISPEQQKQNNNNNNQQQQQKKNNDQQKQYQNHQQTAASEAPVVTTKWETFDLLSSMPSTSSANSTATAASVRTTTSTTTASTHIPRFDWELF